MAPIELFDTHTHLDSKQFEGDHVDVVSRAFERGVTRIVTIGAGSGGSASIGNAIRFAERYPFIWASSGIHPLDAKEDQATLALLRECATHPRVVAIGETGLDFYHNWAPREAQEWWFRKQIELAHDVNKPLIIHSREAGKECLAILKSMDADRVGGVFHCYSEDAEFAKALREINFMVSVPGSVTFKKADSFREIIKAIPIEQIMLETDAPYLAPEPHRGKRCESALMVHTAAKVAEVKGLSLEELARATTENANRFYKLEVK